MDAVSADNAADVIVVGLGAMGAHALWRLASRGAEVLGIEQFTPGHDRGASHGESRIIRTEYVPLLLHAWRLWADLERETGEELVTQTGGLMLGAPDAPFITGPVESARAHGLEYEDWAEIRGLYLAEGMPIKAIARKLGPDRVEIMSQIDLVS